MVERITDPHKPVTVHGTGRLADGEQVPIPPGYQPPHRDGVVATIAVIGGITLVLMVLGIAGVTS